MHKKFKGIFLIFIISFFANGSIYAQIQENPVQWKSSIEQGSGDTLHVKFYAIIKTGWHINSQFNRIEDGPLPTSFAFEKSDHYILTGKVIEPKPLNRIEKEYENQTLYYFENKATFIQKIIPKTNESIKIKAAVTYMSCGSTMCLPPETEEINLKYKPKHLSTNPHYTPQIKEVSLGWIFLGGLLGGFLAILTPCVFSMIPLTVSYFTLHLL